MPDCTRRFRVRRSALRWLWPRRDSASAASAFSSSTFCPAGLTSLLSSSKNTGFSGELRFEIVERRRRNRIVAHRFGRNDRRFARPARAARGGGAGAVPVVGGGGAGRATGGAFLPQRDRGRQRNRRQDSLQSVAPSSSLQLSFGRPVRLFVVADRWSICLRSLPVRAIVKICFLPARVDVNAMWRPLGANAGLSFDALAERQLAHFARRHVDHLDVVARPGARRVRDFVVRRRRPGRPVRIALGRRDALRLPDAVGADRCTPAGCRYGPS